MAEIVNKAWQDPNVNCADLLVKRCNKVIWTERINSRDKNKDFKKAVFKEAFGICEDSNKLINLKSNKDICDREVKPQLSDLIKI